MLKTRRYGVLLAVLLTLAAACGGGASLPSYERFLFMDLLDADTGEQTVLSSRSYCLDPETLPVVSVDGKDYFEVCRFAIGPRPRVHVYYGRYLRIRAEWSPDLVLRLDRDAEETEQAFAPWTGDPVIIDGRSSIWSDNEGVGTVHLQVLCEHGELADDAWFNVVFEYHYDQAGIIWTQELGSESCIVKNCDGDEEPDPDPDDGGGDGGGGGNPLVLHGIYLLVGSFGPLPDLITVQQALVCANNKSIFAASALLVLMLQQFVLLAQDDEEQMIPFLREVAPSSIQAFIRTRDRTLAAAVSDHPPFVADDPPPPESVSRYALLYDLFWVDIVTGDSYRLTYHRPEGQSVSDAKWSPDGRHIAYSLLDHRDMVYTLTLQVLEVETGVVTQVTDKIREAEGFSWSPDGQTLIFSFDGDLWAVDADGTNERMLVAKDSIAPYIVAIQDAEYHPTENKVVCVVRTPGNSRGGVLYILDLDADTATQITDGRNDGLAPESTAEDRYPAWSPSGALIAFNRWNDEPAAGYDGRLMVLEVGSGNPPQIIPNTWEVRDLDW